MITRAGYMGPTFTSHEDMEKRHREYYAQFVNQSVINRVVQRIGADRLLASKDPSFNDIRLKEWDVLARALGPLAVSFKELRDFATLGGLVCIAKEAALQYVESQTRRRHAEADAEWLCAMNWTTPYYGVQHLKGLRPGWRISISDYNTVSTAYVVAPGGGFTACAEYVALRIEDARSWCEGKARSLDAVTQGGAA